MSITSPAGIEFLPRQMIWRQQYRANRYARHLSQSELNVRIRDIFLNLLKVDAEAKIGVGPITVELDKWSQKWTHVLEEMQLRHGSYPAGFTREILHAELFPNFASDLAEKGAKALSALGLKRGDALIKFGKRKYMEMLFATGNLRIQPASFFSNPAHNGAVRDDELTRTMSVVLSRDEVVKLVRNPQDVPSNAPDQRVNVQFRSPTDYWLYCVTSSIEPRLFVDFDADACVIIRDRAEFTQMLRSAAEQALPGTVMQDAPASYIDPLLPQSARLFAPLIKHFGYSYQEEHRYCWLPRVPAAKVSHFDLEIGDMTKISELVTL
jgi:hypothetical protein